MQKQQPKTASPDSLHTLCMVLVSQMCALRMSATAC